MLDQLTQMIKLFADLVLIQRTVHGTVLIAICFGTHSFWAVSTSFYNHKDRVQGFDLTAPEIQ